MLPKFRLSVLVLSSGLLVLLCAALSAQRAFSVDELVTFIKSQIKNKGDDKTTGDYLKKIKLTQKLDERTVEDLQGLGAGPRTVAALKELASASANLPAPPPPPAQLPPKPPPSPAEQAKIMEEMRDYAMNYTMGLPNYICVQTTHRKQDPIDALHRQGYIANGDTIQELLTYFDHKESYQVKMYNGKSMANGAAPTRPCPIEFVAGEFWKNPETFSLTVRNTSGKSISQLRLTSEMFLAPQDLLAPSPISSGHPRPPSLPATETLEKPWIPSGQRKQSSGLGLFSLFCEI